MKLKKLLFSLAAAVFALAAPIVTAQTPAGFSVQVTGTFDYPGTGNLTRPQKINDRGDIVGFYVDSAGESHGFLLGRNGTFSPPLTAPHDTGGLTEARGINNSRTVCGDYLNGITGNYRGFFLIGKTFTTYIIPGAEWTFNLGVNNEGDFCGSTVIHGAGQAYVSIGGTITTFAIPQASETYAYQLNDSDQTCGYYIDAAAVSHGYYVDPDGTIHGPVDPAGSTDTVILGNNNRNIMVGRYTDSSGITHGIVFFPPGRFLVFDYPGAAFTSLNGINAHNEIVGRYTDSLGIDHGLTAALTKDETGSARELPLAAAGATPLSHPLPTVIDLRPAY